VEFAPKQRLFSMPLHPYTKALLSATPSIEPERRNKIRITGELPSPLNPPSGCTFHKRCPYMTERCVTEVPQLRAVDEARVACHYAEAIASGQHQPTRGAQPAQ
jgi:dipeptide transport system ATP-binding protein